MAISAKASMPENSASPNSVSGITSVITSRPMAPKPNATQTGTARQSSSTMPSSGRPMSQPSSVEAPGIPYSSHMSFPIVEQPAAGELRPAVAQIADIAPDRLAQPKQPDGEAEVARDQEPHTHDTPNGKRAAYGKK